MAKIEDQYKSLSASLQSKFGDLILSLDAVNEKFGKLVSQQEKMNEIFQKNSTDMVDLKNQLQDKEQLKNSKFSDRIDLCEEKYVESEKQFILHCDIIFRQNDKFETIYRENKAHSLIVKNIAETEKTFREDIDEPFSILKIDLTTEKDCDKIYRIGRPQNRRNAYDR